MKAHENKWGSFEEFVKAFNTKFWSKQKQKELRWNLVELGWYDKILGNVSVYVWRYYNQVILTA